MVEARLIKGKILLLVGLVLALIALAKYQESYWWLLLALLGYGIGILGARELDKSKKYKNPFKIKSFKNLLRVSILYGLLVGLTLSWSNSTGLIGTFVLVVMAILTFFTLFYIYHRIKGYDK